jgi:cell pole-organizing protein PopZ
MSQSAKAHEPSMEEILASIRRIIADDDTPRAAAPKPEPVAPPPLRAVAPPPSAPAPPSPPRPVLKSSAEQDETSAMLTALDSPATDEAPAASSADALELTDTIAAPSQAQNSPNVATHPKARRDSPPALEPRPEPPAAADEAWRAHAPSVERGLLSSEASAAVGSAFNTLARTVLLQNARTLEDLVREMLQPMLKSWLDDNLPSMVERIVRAEIERISRGRA